MGKISVVTMSQCLNMASQFITGEMSLKDIIIPGTSDIVYSEEKFLS